MPITTIADALANVGGNISEVLKQEGRRREQALEAQQQTNELQYKQGLLGLEAQKATAVGQLGLAKAGAEARQWAVGSEQKERELMQTGEYQRGTLDIHREQNRNLATYNEGQLRIGERNAASAATNAATNLLNVQQHKPLLEAQAKEAQTRTEELLEKRRLDKEMVPIEPEFAQAENMLRATYPEATVQIILGHSKTLMETRHGDAHTLPTDANGQHLMERGRLRESIKGIWDTIKTTLREQPTLGDLQKSIDRQIEARQKAPDRGDATDPQITNMVTAEHLYLPQLNEATRIIAQNNQQRIERAEAAEVAKKKGFLTPNPVLTEDERKTIRAKVAQLAIEDRFRAAETLNSTKGGSHGITPLPPVAPTAVPPPAPSPPPTGPAPGAHPGVPPPVPAPPPPTAPTPTPPRFVMPEGGVPMYKPPAGAAPSVNVTGAIGRALAPIFSGPERGYVSPAVPGATPETPPVAPVPVDASSPVGLAVETALAGLGSPEHMTQILTGTPDGIYQVPVGNAVYQVMIAQGQLLQVEAMTPPGAPAPGSP